ncbi:ZIP family metal transporter [Hymenobacter sp. 5317J-9]|uniref:ZIP family metal transporter n=1 Tax=Hymenobacter sp. 5317J-9 TaxID=2932250 RepID=UPI001FD6F31A|nr:ZIP family metal transporter [Hymenobacter sp. 5317J-9]UOQ97867.1 ZIP family metal transporter [Hymenobacter sp. 5317J-9]
MGFAIFLLLLTVLGAGAAAAWVPVTQGSRWLKPLLAFSGAYLFTLTVTHILPEALQLLPEQPARVGYWVLAGFFGQLLLEVLSQGVEHGHVHHEPAHGAHTGVSRVPFLLLAALVVHSFLEGSILVKTPEVGQISQNFYAIVVGVALHHVPAAFALATLLRLRLGSFRRVWPGLLVFALASPVGIVFSNYVVLSKLLSSGLYASLLGLVAGNFLHVSTTILFETSPEHRLNWPKLGATLAGLLLALAVA